MNDSEQNGKENQVRSSTAEDSGGLLVRAEAIGTPTSAASVAIQNALTKALAFGESAASAAVGMEAEGLALVVEVASVCSMAAISKLVILQLIADKPSYGYELIKAMEERLAGGYAPSPGVVYPTLTMLEEEGLATVATSDGGKKVYTATDAGRSELTANQRRLAEIFERLEHAGRGFRRGRSPEIMRAFMTLRSAVEARVSREGLTADQIAKMAEAIEAAARAIDAM